MSEKTSELSKLQNIQNHLRTKVQIEKILKLDNEIRSRIDDRISLLADNKRNQYAVHGETSSAYFLRMQNHKAKQALVRKLEINGKESKDPTEIKENVTTHLSKLFKREQNEEERISASEYLGTHADKLPKLSQTDSNSLNHDISIIEIQDSLDKAIGKGSRAPGQDGVTPALINKTFPMIDLLILTGFNRVLNGLQDLTYNLLSFRVILIPKIHSKKKDIRKLRPICLYNALYKIYSSIVTKRLISGIQKGNLIDCQQYGYLPSKTACEATRSILDLIQVANSANKQIAAVSCDLSDAFNNINREYLLESLLLYGYPSKIIQGVKSLILGNRRPTASLCFNNEIISEPIQSNTGSGQGDSVSGIIFVLAQNLFTLKLRLDNPTMFVSLPQLLNHKK